MAGGTAERVVVALTYVVLATIAVVSGGIEAFLVPQRLGHGIEGLSALLAFAGNLAVGLLGGIGTKTIAGALVPAVSWLVAVLFIATYSSGGDVIVPGSLPTDPGIPYVTAALLLAGLFASGIATVVTLRFTTRADQPTSPM